MYYAKWVEEDRRFAFSLTDNGGAEISSEQHAELMEAQSRGASIVVGEDDYPEIRRDAAQAHDNSTPVTAEPAGYTISPSSRVLRIEKMTLAIERAQHFDMMGEAEQAAAWRGYYRELHALEQSPEWPLVTQWPTPPDMLAA